MKISFRFRVLATIGISCVLCTASAVLVARSRIEANSERALIEKSAAILSRLEVGRDYVAEMGTLKEVVNELVRKHPDGNLAPDEKKFVLRNVPVFAAMKLGQSRSEAEGYRFRVFDEHPRNKDNSPNEAERAIYKRFAADAKLQEVVERSADGNFILVSRPVRLAESQGCLTCHGHPSTSPWGNGKDILSHEMENMKDGDMKGVFQIISSLDSVKAATQASTSNILGWGSALTLVALALGFFLVGAPIAKIKRVGEELHATSTEVASASSQVSSISQSISNNATTAASSLEETVASLEELSSIVTRNADNAAQAAQAAEASLHSAQSGESEIRHLVIAMTEIAQSSRRIEEIINVIDDIAFQTNLLALNAAVEAARAGEQGRGFAVVAEAVRGLAQKSAEAARQVNDLIKESSSKVEAGGRLADSSGTALKEILESVRKVVDQNHDIAAASLEQAQGIAQISQAMNQLDQVSQENASSSEQSAASAEEMAAQSESLRHLVLELESIMQGTSGSKSARAAGPRTAPPIVQSFKPAPKAKTTRSAKTSKAAELIPFDEPASGQVLSDADSIEKWEKSG
jgi:methyl-accepting chemotaxis protein